MINVNNVYMSVLAILNKEHRGEMSPDAFNNAAKQVQLERYNATSVEYNKALNLRKRYGSNEGFADQAQFLEERIAEISRVGELTLSEGVANSSSLNAYRLLDVYDKTSLESWEELTHSEFIKINASPLTIPSSMFPVFYKTGGDNGITITASPNVSGINDATVGVSYIPFPSNPRWGYFEDENFGTEIYDDNKFVKGGIVVDKAITAITQNVNTTGFDGTYNVEGVVSSGGTIRLDVVADGGAIISATVTSLGDGINASEGDTVTVQTSVTYDGNNIPIGVENTSTLILVLQFEDLYINSLAGSTDFELHPSEENNVITGILAYAGLVVKDDQITQFAAIIEQYKEMQKQQQ